MFAAIAIHQFYGMKSVSKTNIHTIFWVYIKEVTYF